MTDHHSISRRRLLLAQSALLAMPALLAPASARAQAGHQGAWGSCSKCNAMTWTSGHDSGVCPAGGEHSNDASYFLRYDAAKPPGPIQWDWRFCNKCWALFWDGDPNNKGRCAAGG